MSDAQCHYLLFYKFIEEAEKKCLRPCKNTEFEGSIQKNQMKTEDGTASFGLYYQSTVVAIHSEHLIYDILTFIGTVGGSLGLFIGFSFYDGFLLLEKLTCKKLENELNHEKSTQSEDFEIEKFCKHQKEEDCCFDHHKQ